MPGMGSSLGVRVTGRAPIGVVAVTKTLRPMTIDAAAPRRHGPFCHLGAGHVRQPAYRAAMPGSPELPALPPPPRHVPWTLRAVLALRHPLAFVGWIILGVGTLLGGVFVGMAEPWIDPFDDGARRLSGRVVAVDGTSIRVNDRNVTAVTFEWPADAPRARTVSYTDRGAPAVGAEIAIEVQPGDPPLVRAVGMRRAPFPAFVHFVLLFPALGLLIVVFFVRLGLRRAAILRDGDLVLGMLVSTEPTNMRVNRRPVWKLTYAYTDRAGVARTAVARSTRVDADGGAAPMLHVPGTDTVVRLADLPSVPRVGADGAFAPPTSGALALALLPPTLIALGWSAVQGLVAP
jgi:hypothetical protein